METSRTTRKGSLWASDAEVRSAPLSETREALRALACYVVAPARKVRTGRISLRPTGRGFGTPPFDDGTRVTVQGDRLFRGDERGITVTTLRAAANFVGVELDPDPGVGEDLPPFAPDAPLRVDADASLALGRWYAFGDELLDELRAVADTSASGAAKLWPEHFDLATTLTLRNGAQVNVGFSPGDSYRDTPYVYVGPHERDRLVGDFWNAPFGAVLGGEMLNDASTAHADALTFLQRGLRLLA